MPDAAFGVCGPAGSRNVTGACWVEVCQRHLDNGGHLTMTKLFTKLKEDINALLPPTIFCLVALHLVERNWA